MNKLPTDASAPSPRPDRRLVLLGAGTALAATVLGASPQVAAAGKGKEKNEENVGPGEDLMREHGVLRRILLVYREASHRLEGVAGFDVGALQKSARLMRTFIEDYHERQEEEIVFPRFEKANKLSGLVAVLRAQHRAGRKVTERVQGLATLTGITDSGTRRQLRGDLLAFIRMYEPHASREDTVLFPALHDLMSVSEYAALGEDFERREHKAFGGDGFEHAVAEIAAIERTLGIEDLARFTPAA